MHPAALRTVDCPERPPLRAFKGAVLALLALTCLCAMGSDALAQQRPKLKVLVHGPVKSPLLKSLRPSARLIRYRGDLQELEGVDMVLVDGDRHTPEALQTDELVLAALRSGVWVMALDVTEDHKRVGFGETLMAAGAGSALACVMRMGEDQYGRPLVQIIELPSEEPAPSSARLRPWVAPQPKAFDSVAASSFLDLVVDRVTNPTALYAITGDAAAPPDGLSYVKFLFTRPYTDETDEAFWEKKRQHPTIQLNTQYTVFLSKGNGTPDFQFVSAEVNVAATPKGPSEDFAAINHYLSANHSPNYDEQGWFQTRVRYELNPETQWSTWQTSPATANGTENVTTGFSFSVGFNQAQGGLGNYTYSNSVTRTIQDWKVTNESVGNQAMWDYRSQNPVDADKAFDYDQHFVTVGGLFWASPNDLSLNTLNLGVAAVWKTSSVENNWAKIDTVSKHQMVDMWCPDITGGLVCVDFPEGFARDYWHSPWDGLNMAAVVPTRIASLTFSAGGDAASPVPAFTPVTGTITLERPAPLDTTIYLSSNSGSAVISGDTRVKVKAGQTQATFTIQTNDNDIEKCGDLRTATIRAIDGDSYDFPLYVKKTQGCP